MKCPVNWFVSDRSLITEVVNKPGNGLSYIFFGAFLILALIIVLNDANHSLFFTINSMHNLLPIETWEFFNFIAASKLFILPAALLAITFIFKRNKIFQVVLLILLYYVVFMVLKQLVGEARPYIVLDSSSFFWLNKFENATSNAYKSFPSGHTGNMAIFAFALNSMFFQNKRYLQFLMLLLVIFTGLSRIVTGWHWPLDVLFSGLISYLLVKICFAIKLRR